MAQLAEEAALKAVDLKDSLAEPHATLGFISQFKNDWDTGEREHQRALELNPNYPTAHHFYGNFLKRQGRFDEALAELRQAQSLDPLAPRIGMDLAEVLIYRGQLDLAIEEVKRALELQPDFGPGHVTLGRAYVRKGMYEEALTHFQQESANEVVPVGTAFVAYTLAVTGKRENALELVKQIETANIHPHYVAMAYVGLGETDKAFEWLDRSIETVDSVPTDTFGGWFHFEFDPIRDDPRFHDLLRRMNLEP